MLLALVLRPREGANARLATQAGTLLARSQGHQASADGNPLDQRRSKSSRLDRLLAKFDALEVICPAHKHVAYMVPAISGLPPPRWALVEAKQTPRISNLFPLLDTTEGGALVSV